MDYLAWRTSFQSNEDNPKTISDAQSWIPSQTVAVYARLWT